MIVVLRLTGSFLAAPALILVRWAAVLVLVLVYNQVLAFLLADGAAGPGVLVLIVLAIAVGNLLALHLYRH